ncbi:pectate lyase [Flavobacterium sp. RSSA_27]|uniref:pectate lyase n=1 Tax=Flavobacterium sp. RSSA_27 TaxID=3447667 RepID=UPI003F3F4F4F
MKNFFLLVTFIVSSFSQAQVHDKKWASIVDSKEGPWFASDEAKNIAENVLLYQRNIGGWPKNIQMQLPLSEASKQQLLSQKNATDDLTIDNGATTQEMLFLSKMYRQTKDKRYEKAFLDGLNYILAAQYDNGGWPQFYPLKKGYYTHITFNDDAITNILAILKELKNNTNYFSITPSKSKLNEITTAYNKAIECILKTQYKQNGTLTAWCAQHDELTLEPAKARAYELPSLSGKESAKIVLTLMAIENPSPEIIFAVNSAVAWFEKTKITNLKIVDQTNSSGKVMDRKVVVSENEPPIWARFMELDTNEPFFCDRDGIKKKTLAEIGEERRNGYAWYTNEPKEVLKKYPAWLKKIGPNANTKANYVVVDASGKGDFTSIQEAINAAPAFPDQAVTIAIKKGTYYEKVKVHAWNTKITMIGESKENTIITFDDHFKKMNVGRNSTFHTYTLLVEGNDFVAENLTIANSAGEVGQAVALNVNANRVRIQNCNLLGNQDTLYTSGEGTKNYFKDCYIEGTTDFIFGDATVLFENCTLHSKKDSFITAASTPKDTEFGYVFINCKLTAEKNIKKVYLGRPWRSYAKTVFITCHMEDHILPVGWHNWSKPEAEQTCFYAEFQCSGPGFQPQKRVSWSKQLDVNEIQKYTKETILSDNHKNWYQKN